MCKVGIEVAVRRILGGDGGVREEMMRGKSWLYPADAVNRELESAIELHTSSILLRRTAV